jgi:molybdopterin-guanine dinucleotide biosynthesis protein B
LAAEDPHIVAVLVDGPKPATQLPVIDLNDIGAIADFVMRHCGFQSR